MTGHLSILVVGHNRRNLELLAQFLGKEDYAVLTAASLEEFDQALAGAQEIGLALVDLAGFDRRIWERCDRLWDEKKIPFLVLLSRQSAVIQQEGLARGARGMLVKPLVIKELLQFIRNLLVESK